MQQQHGVKGSGGAVKEESRGTQVRKGGLLGFNPNGRAFYTSTAQGHRTRPGQLGHERHGQAAAASPGCRGREPVLIRASARKAWADFHLLFSVVFYFLFLFLVDQIKFW
jgi:hypothetical protein